jgi:hypothetical protein
LGRHRLLRLSDRATHSAGVDLNSGVTTMPQDLMSPDQLKRERELWDVQHSFEKAQANAKLERGWRTMAGLLPLFAGFMLLMFSVTVGFTVFRVWADMWTATHWW